MINFKKVVLAYVDQLTRRGSFVQNIAISFSGNIAAQGIGVLFTPILARIYGPEVYGIFALLMALVNNLSQISTLQLPSGFVSARSEHELFGVIRFTILFLLLFCVFCFLVVLLLGQSIVKYFNIVEIEPFLFWIPIYLVFIGIDNVLFGWSIRVKEFKRSAFAKVLSVTVSRGTSLILGLLYPGNPLGIIVGNFFSYPIDSLAKWSKSIRQTKVTDLFRSALPLRSLTQRYKEYWLYVTPGLFLTNLSNLLPVYFFSIFFDHKEVGYFAMASGIISMPLSLIVNSSSAVFLQKAAETLANSREKLANLVLSVHNSLFVLAFIPLAVLALSGEWIFEIFFGSEWAGAPIFVSFLCLAYVYNVVHAPISLSFRLINRERLNFIALLTFFVMRFAGLWLGVYYDSILISLVAYTITTMLSQLVPILIVYRLLKIPLRSLVMSLASVVLLAITIFYVTNIGQ